MRKTVIVLAAAASLTAGAVEAEIHTKKVEYTHGELALEGFLAWDDSLSGKRPGVLVVHEWWGLNDYAQRRATELAEEGYVAFALDMYGKGKVTEHPEEAGAWARAVAENLPLGLERAQLGLDVLRDQELVDPQRIAAIGYCFGGSTVLHMAFNGFDLAGVVSFHGSLPLPPEKPEVKAKILIAHGAKDAFVSPEHLQTFHQALNGLDADWQMVYYSGAVHSFTAREADQRGISGLAYNAAADRRSWAYMKLFLEEIFRP